jgi:hypothetical protein
MAFLVNPNALTGNWENFETAIKAPWIQQIEAKPKSRRLCERANHGSFKAGDERPLISDCSFYYESVAIHSLNLGQPQSREPLGVEGLRTAHRRRWGYLATRRLPV